MAGIAPHHADSQIVAPCAFLLCTIPISAFMRALGHPLENSGQELMHLLQKHLCMLAISLAVVSSGNAATLVEPTRR